MLFSNIVSATSQVIAGAKGGAGKDSIAAVAVGLDRTGQHRSGDRPGSRQSSTPPDSLERQRRPA